MVSNLKPIKNEHTKHSAGAFLEFLKLGYVKPNSIMVNVDLVHVTKLKSAAE